MTIMLEPGTPPIQPGAVPGPSQLGPSPASQTFDVLVPVYNLAKRAQVSWSLHYGESDDSWYFVVRSIAPSENFCGKNRSLVTAVADVLDHLRGLIKV